ncbi:MAG: bifunctional UDP-N-acetylglucosamine diphosphorylase/glucosamine-1-phosphate N-acetyltransferase GlmU [Pseudomonadota bacterium]
MTETPISPRPLAVVVLAAGKGTRMKSALPKVLHPLAGQPMLGHVMATATALGPERIAVVVGAGADQVAAAAGAAVQGVDICLQAEQRGTGHAVRMAEGALAGFEGDLLVLYADTPLLSVATLRRLLAAPGAIKVLGFEAADPGRYGRLVIDGERLLRIVEAKDTTPEEYAITACNSGVMAGDAATMFRLLAKVTDDNAQGEFYLTDVPGIAGAEGLSATATLCAEEETLGINDRVQLAAAEAVFQRRARQAAMLAGATLIDPETVYFAHDTVLGRDVTVGPSVVFGPGVAVADGARIEAFCHLEDTRIGSGAVVGPFARLRGGTEIGANCRVGNFVEMKKTGFGEGAKAAHLTYVGDATVGAGANLGAGTVTCNYDGVDKHRTTIGAGAFIGTHASLIAPVTIGDGAYVATGTVVTQNVPAEALAIARVKQTNREGTARRLREVLAARKAAKKG